MDELGITDALACFTKGDIGGCVETAINVATSFVGGMVAKFARKYGAPWKWKKGAQLGKKVWGILGKPVDGVKKFFKCRNSFVPGTLVLMADGSRKKIEDVDVGEVVVATDPETGETVAKAVVATIIGQGAKNLVEITVDTDGASGSATGLLVATDGHPFWVADLGQWVPATDLEAGQMLRTSSGTWVQVTSIRRWTEQARVYNFTVDDIHTYHVFAGTVPVLVHNANGDWFPDRPLPRDRYGNPIPDSPYPHTQLGQKEGRRGSFPQAREFDKNGKPVWDIDFTGHGRPNVSGHTNPHEHPWLENITGGTSKRGPAQPLEMC